MPLAAGTRLGPYEILAPIGKGGMGEVYRARDTKLERDVAIKVLPDELASDEERVARFEREAKLLASLNHPNIASIHGFEESDGVKALVLELVEGPTLAERIAKGPIPVDETIAIAKQIAEALEAGHEAGVIHRDLKPANIKVREDGTVKVLDYGLAKALEGDAPAGDDSELSQSRTLTRQGTQIGVILGTAAYMSPEQARGKPVDKRTDIWAFAVVVYEMLTGRRTFEAEDVSLTLAAVMTSEPDLTVLPSSTPPVLETVIRRCLVKDLKKRIRDIGDVHLAIEGAFETTAVPVPIAAPIPVPPWRRAILLVSALMVGAIAAGLAFWALYDPGMPEVARFDVTPEGGMTVTATSPSIALSPDGKTVAYLAEGLPGVGAAELRVRSLDRLDPVTLVSDTIGSPFFSPDGGEVGFMVPGGDNRPHTLKRVSIQGGPPSTITEFAFPLHGASWGTDGTIVFATRDGATGLWRVPAVGGKPTLLTTPSESDGGGDHFWPEILPGGNAVLFTILGSTEEASQIAVFSIATGEQRVLLRGGSFPRYSPTGHVLYGRDGTLWAVPFDLDRLQIQGESLPALEGVLTKGLTRATEVSLSETGTLLYVSADMTLLDTPDRRLIWVDAAGREELALTPAGRFNAVALSPDGTKVALGTYSDDAPAELWVSQARSTQARADLWVSDVARGTLMRLTGGGMNVNPIWSPDGQRIAYGSTRNGRPEVLWQSADGTGAAETVIALEPPYTEVLPSSWSPDGTILSLAVHQATQSDIGIVRVGEPESFQLLGSEETGERSERYSAISPDGRWIAYTSFENTPEVYVQRFPDGGGRQAVSIGGGVYARWSADGRSLTYVRIEDREPVAVMRVAVSAGDAPRGPLVFGTPTELFPWRGYHGRRSNLSFFDMTSDGERFLMIETAAAAVRDAAPVRMILVQNWFEELKRLATTDQ